MREVFICFCDSFKQIEDVMKKKGKEFMWNKYLGFIFMCFFNLGMGLCVGVYVKFFLFLKDVCFDDIFKKLCLQKCGIGGVDIVFIDGIFDVLNLD